MHYRSQFMVGFEIDTGEAVELGAQTRLFEQLPLRSRVGCFSRLRGAPRQLPIQAPVRVMNQEDSASAIEDRASRAEGDP